MCEPFKKNVRTNFKKHTTNLKVVYFFLHQQVVHGKKVNNQCSRHARCEIISLRRQQITFRVKRILRNDTFMTLGRTSYIQFLDQSKAHIHF